MPSIMVSRTALVTALAACVVLGVRAQPTFVNPHNGMTFFYTDVHHTIPPNATVANAASAVSCSCSDADPRSDDTLLVTYNCFHQRVFGNCNASFMAGALEELVETEGYCQMSCGKCTCCDSPYNVIEKLGATRFLQAAEAAGGNFTDLLKLPGMLGTLLVPDNDAWDAALAQHPSLLHNPELLLQVIKFGWLPPEPRTQGLWTTPFMSVGAKMYTYYDGPAALQTTKSALPDNVTVYGGLTGIKVNGPYNAATITAGDVRACKLYIDVIDTVLWPFNPAGNATAAVSAGDMSLQLGDALGAPTCVSVPNAVMNGTALVDGASNRKPSVGDCCDACASTDGCNVWQYCPLAGGCRWPDGTVDQYGYCALLRSSQVASGGEPLYGDSGILTVPIISGYIPAGSPAPAAAGRR